MQDRRRAHRGGRAGTVVAAAVCSTDLLRAPEQSFSTDHSRRAPTAAQRKNLTQKNTPEEKTATSQDHEAEEDGTKRRRRKE
ncbi:hypothetical protein VZT92_006079 [Zoarces viviparus]|uniref:Secreted protein n=1 Tax=Zoarces viviparus TaxID=48416 RepID=A0AAW1FNI7_ZOAVI